MFFKLPVLIVLPIYIFIVAVFVYLIYLLIMALRKYLKSESVRKENLTWQNLLARLLSVTEWNAK